MWQLWKALQSEATQSHPSSPTSSCHINARTFNIIESEMRKVAMKSEHSFIKCLRAPKMNEKIKNGSKSGQKIITLASHLVFLSYQWTHIQYLWKWNEESGREKCRHFFIKYLQAPKMNEKIQNGSKSGNKKITLVSHLVFLSHQCRHVQYHWNWNDESGCEKWRRRNLWLTILLYF